MMNRKNVLFIALLAAFAVAASFSFSSCKKDKKDELATAAGKWKPIRFDGNTGVSVNLESETTIASSLNIILQMAKGFDSDLNVDAIAPKATAMLKLFASANILLNEDKSVSITGVNGLKGSSGSWSQEGDKVTVTISKLEFEENPNATPEQKAKLGKIKGIVSALFGKSFELTIDGDRLVQHPDIKALIAKKQAELNNASVTEVPDKAATLGMLNGMSMAVGDHPTIVYAKQ